MGRADINSSNVYGNTVLFTAAQKGYADICKLLLEYGADKDRVNNVGESAMTIAVKNGHAHIV